MSKGLEALELIFDDLRQFEEHFLNGLTKGDIERYETIKKELQVLEIIKNKMVNLYQIWVYDDYEKYKYYYPFGEYHAIEAMLTQEEFELIKGVVLK